MKKRIDFEAHYYTPEIFKIFRERSVPPLYDPDKKILRYSKDFSVADPVRIERLLYTPEQRIADMDSAGIDMQIVSTSAGYEMIETEDSIKMCRIANDTVAAWMQKYPERISGYAVLPVKDIRAAQTELERCMKQLNFFGWGAFSNFGATALDDDMYFPLLECAADLGAPIYIHPTNPYEGRLTGMGHVLISAGVGGGIDTTITLIRMILKGVFDRLPDIKVLIGHLGDGLPFTLDRINRRTLKPSRAPAVNKEMATYYFSKNIWVTSSGVFSNPSFRCTRDVMGIDRILFGSDYPYEDMHEVNEFLSELDYSDEEQDRLFYKNAERYFVL